MPQRLSRNLPTRRRVYKKSTTGCSSCKSRKIKCDEAKPSCLNCRKRYFDASCCQYDSIPAKSPPNRTRSTSDVSGHSMMQLPSPISPKPSGLGDGDGNARILELRLFHHYTSSTTSRAQNLQGLVPLFVDPRWAIDIPQMAFSSEMVLNSLFAISALNLSAMYPEDELLARASISYLDKAVKEYRTTLAKVDELSAEPCLVSAVMMAHYTWLSSNSKDPKKEQYQLHLQTYYMCLGIKALIGKLSPWLQSYDWPAAVGRIPKLEELPQTGFLESAVEDLALLSQHFSSDETSPENRWTYEKTAEDLIEIYCLLSAGSVDVAQMEQNLVTFLHRVPSHLITLLEGKDPIAMALLARNLAVLVFLEDSKAWWIHGSGKHKVYFKSIWGIHGLMPSNLLWTMDWPLKVIKKEIRLDHRRFEAIGSPHSFDPLKLQSL